MAHPGPSCLTATLILLIQIQFPLQSFRPLGGNGSWLCWLQSTTSSLINVLQPFPQSLHTVQRIAMWYMAGLAPVPGLAWPGRAQLPKVRVLILLEVRDGISWLFFQPVAHSEKQDGASPIELKGNGFFSNYELFTYKKLQNVSPPPPPFILLL